MTQTNGTPTPTILSLAAGDPGGSVASRAGSGVAAVAVYTVVAIASVWWQHL
jgi:hypothetical protein